MILFARIAAGLVALFGILMGLRFLADPLKLGAEFFLSPNGVAGLAVLRADMTAFFLVSGIMAALAAWKREPKYLVAPALLYGIAITGRAISLALDGKADGAFIPMTVEAVLVLLCLFAYRTFSTSKG